MSFYSKVLSGASTALVLCVVTHVQAQGAPPSEPPAAETPPVDAPPAEPPPGEAPPTPESPPAQPPPPAQPSPPGPPPQGQPAYPPGYQPPPPGYGQPPQGYGQPPPGYVAPAYGPPPQQYPPPPPKGPDLSERRHDGFYLRLGIGVGYGNVSSSGEAGSTDVDITFKGLGPVYELLIGGTPGGGFVIGGGFAGQDITEPDIEVTVGSGASAEGVADDQALGVGVVGPFLDWFPDETGGAHVGLLAGIGVIGVQDDKGDSSSGFGASLFGGYDFWVGKQWSIGPEARFVYVSAKRDSGTGPLQSSYDDTALSAQLLFTALYH